MFRKWATFRRWHWATIAAVMVAGVLVAASGGGAQAANDPTDDSITVSGVGTAAGTPDTLTVDFIVRVRRTTVQDALNAQSHDTNLLVAALKKDGLKDADITTTDLELYKVHNRKTGFSGYQASESVEASISPLDSAGKTISDAASSSSHVDIGGMEFSISDVSALMKTARDNAYADAKDRATQYAGLSSRTLGRVEHVTEKVNDNSTAVYASGVTAAGSTAPAVPISPGQQTITVNVTVVFQLT
jgi:uncharacterized protein YggE